MSSGGYAMREAMALQSFHPEKMTAIEALSAEDRAHVHHAWAQAEDGDGICRPHIDACVRLGFMEKITRRRWEFTPAGEDAAATLYALWAADMFDPITGTLADQETRPPEEER